MGYCLLLCNLHPCIRELVKVVEKSAPKKRMALDKAKLLKLLNDEESDLSSDSEEEEDGEGKINADSSDEG